mmetsp:Transcript_31602/g.78277  ORF Transcript_31602/g.78277 Transcript_31602/m.78277 type:complete len:301 (-) Transcript_31602:163-1065(-)
MHLDQTDLLAFAVEVVDTLLEHWRAGAHDDHTAVGLLVSVVHEESVGAADDGSHLGHDALDDLWQLGVEGVGGLDALEEHVGALRGAALVRVGRVQRLGTVPLQLRLHVIEEGLHLFVVEDFDLLELVRCAESVEEVHKGDRALEGGQVGDKGHVARLLHRVRRQHPPAALANGHHVAVISKDGQRLPGDRPGGDMEDAGHELPGDLVHVGYHEQQPLGGREGRGECARRQAAVHRPRRAGLALHLAAVDLLPEQVLPPLRCPQVNELGHGGRRRDGVDEGHIREGVRYVRSRRISVNDV